MNIFFTSQIFRTSSARHIQRLTITTCKHSLIQQALYTTSTPTMPSTISLNPPERLFRQCLLDCRDEMQDVPGMKGLVLRWTGGWVRDKLLGTQSHDIDVALSTMTGVQFGEALKSFMTTNGHRYEKEAELGGFKAEIKNLHKIAANPEKSKHLETITTRMFGIDVDFVNLRKEVYDENSRNPQMEFGTPEEDALRRDATVNALFYNLDEQCVEDFTKNGLADMQKKLIRTPLAPYQTFKDDPLRVLRLIRFASRLNYEIVEEAQEAMKDRTIHEALRAKISRERVGVEVEKIVSGPDPHKGLMLIQNFELYHAVFANPFKDFCPQISTLPKVYDGLSRVLSDVSTICVALKPKENQGLIWTLAAYVPWKAQGAEAVTAAREGIRAANVITKVLGDAIKNRERLSELVDAANNGTARRGYIGTALRHIGATWPSQLMYSILCDMEEEDFEAVIQRYTGFLRWLNDENLMDAAIIKPILNGNEIMRVLEAKKAGSWLKDAIERVVEWQFDNPDGTAEEARAWISSKKGDLQLS